MRKLFLTVIIFCISLSLFAWTHRNFFNEVKQCINSARTINTKSFSTPTSYNNDRGPRTFSKTMRLKKYNEQQGICAHCGKRCSFSEMEGDHIIPWSKGGETTYSNLQMLCRHCNRSKGNRFSY